MEGVASSNKEIREEASEAEGKTGSNNEAESPGKGSTVDEKAALAIQEKIQSDALNHKVKKIQMATDSKRKLSKLSGPIKPVSNIESMKSLRQMGDRKSSSKYSSIHDTVDSQVAMVNEFNERNAQRNFYFSTGHNVDSI